ncbi:substrate-binding domain-containing protein [Muricomes intestini]|jgi:ribose transport system substrate-binding protein|uniref:substrate-binding domain-containing protein n=1 Tax=Muricomes intestini TaxID=1796634 RepID=UPI002FDF84A6
MKRRMKAVLAIAVLAVMLVVGCGAKGSDDSKDAGKNNANTEEKKVVGVSLLNSTHVFYNNIQKAMEEKVAELGWELIVQDAAGDANKQLSQVQDFITSKVDAIVIAPTNSAGSKSMVELADKAGIPMFTMDIKSDGEVISHVATDNHKGGELAAEYTVDKLLTDKKGNVVVITYSEIESCVDREEGFTEYLAENAPDIKVLDIQNYAGDQQKAADVMQNMLLKHDKIDVVFCVGDPAATGALSSITAAGKDTKIIGYDGNPEGIDEIKKGGVWVADVAQDASQIGTKTLEAVQEYLDGTTPEKEILVEPYIIDKENAK